MDDMKIGDYYSAVHDVINQVGQHGTTLWMHPDDWDNLMDGSGPPKHIRQQERNNMHLVATKAMMDMGYPGPPQWVAEDGDEVGRFEFCPVHIDSTLRRGVTQIRSGDDIHGVPVGPFEPATEPAGGWGKPLHLPNKDTA